MLFCVFLLETTIFQQTNLDFRREGLLIIRFINHGGSPFFKLHFFWASRGSLIIQELIILDIIGNMDTPNAPFNAPSIHH